MDVKKLNFFQKQYLTTFKDKRNKPKAKLYHYIISFVLENSYAPNLYELEKEFSTRKKTLITDLKWLIKCGLVLKKRLGENFFFIPILKPFVMAEETKYEVYTRFSGSKKYARGINLKNKLKEITDGHRRQQQKDWVDNFKEAGYRDNKKDNSKTSADEYDKDDLPPNFDGSENSSGVVIL